MASKKYVSLSKLSTFLDNLKNTFAQLSHKHTISDLSDYTVDSALSSTSTNPVQNKVLDAEFDAIADAMNALDLAIDDKADTDHNHTISDITDLAEATQTSSGLMSASDKIQLDNGGIPIVAASSEDGVAYTATVDGLGALTAGVAVTIVPSFTATSTTPTLNINGLGAVGIRRKLSSGTLTRPALQYANVIYKGVAVNLMYDGTYWVATQFTKPSATDLYGYVSVQHGGTYVNSETTEEDIAEARENLSVYSRADHDWNLIYDSGETTEQINSFANINISGYKKLMVAVHCVNDTTNASTTRYGSAIFKATNGTTYQMPVFNSMFNNSTNHSATLALFNIVDGWLICPQSIRSVKYNDFMSSTEGGTGTNMNGMGGGMMKCTNTLSTMTISSLDQNADFYFGVGSRVIVWGCNA